MYGFLYRQKRIRSLWLKVMRGEELVDGEDHLRGVLLLMKNRITKVKEPFCVSVYLLLLLTCGT